MEISGIIKRIDETKEFGAKGFKKRVLILETEEKFPQPIPVEFVQDKVSLLDDLNVEQSATISINLRGRHYDGRDYVSVQGWKIETGETGNDSPDQSDEEDKLPF